MRQALAAVFENSAFGGFEALPMVCRRRKSHAAASVGKARALSGVAVVSGRCTSSLRYRVALVPTRDAASLCRRSGAVYPRLCGAGLPSFRIGVPLALPCEVAVVPNGAPLSLPCEVAAVPNRDAASLCRRSERSVSGFAV